MQHRAIRSGSPRRRKGAISSTPTPPTSVEEIRVYPEDRPLDEGEYRKLFFDQCTGWMRIIGKDVTFGPSDDVPHPVTIFVPSEEIMDAPMLRAYRGYSQSKLNQDSYINAIVGQIRHDEMTRSTRAGTRKDWDRRPPRRVKVHTRQHAAHYASTIRAVPEPSGMTEDERALERDERRLARSRRDGD
jgi:hypothetical protein